MIRTALLVVAVLTGSAAGLLLMLWAMALVAASLAAAVSGLWLSDVLLAVCAVLVGVAIVLLVTWLRRGI